MSRRNRDRFLIVAVGPRVRVTVPIAIARVWIRAKVVRTRVRTVTGPCARTSAIAISAGIRRVVRTTVVDCVDRNVGGGRDRSFVWDRVDNV